MSRAPVAVVAIFVALILPAQAFAANDNAVLNQPPISLIVSLVGLGVAVVLLMEALNVRRVGSGGAIAEKISYVVLATVCLAASAVAQWMRNFVEGVTLDQVQFASQVFVIAAMALLAAYFSSVRRALQAYMKAATRPSPPSAPHDGEEDAARG